MGFLNSKNASLLIALLVVVVITFTYVIIQTNLHKDIYTDMNEVSLVGEED